MTKGKCLNPALPANYVLPGGLGHLLARGNYFSIRELGNIPHWRQVKGSEYLLYVLSLLRPPDGPSGNYYSKIGIEGPELSNRGTSYRIRVHVLIFLTSLLLVRLGANALTIARSLNNSRSISTPTYEVAEPRAPLPVQFVALHALDKGKNCR